MDVLLATRAVDASPFSSTTPHVLHATVRPPRSRSTSVVAPHLGHRGGGTDPAAPGGGRLPSAQRPLVRPPSLPAALAVSLVNGGGALPCACTARPPIAAIRRLCSSVIPANPRLLGFSSGSTLADASATPDPPHAPHTRETGGCPAEASPRPEHAPQTRPRAADGLAGD